MVILSAKLTEPDNVGILKEDRFANKEDLLNSNYFWVTHMKKYYTFI